MVRKTATYFYLTPISSTYHLQHQVQASTRLLYSKSRYSTVANLGTNFIVTTGINISLNDAGRRFLFTTRAYNHLQVRSSQTQARHEISQNLTLTSISRFNKLQNQLNQHVSHR